MQEIPLKSHTSHYQQYVSSINCYYISFVKAISICVHGYKLFACVYGISSDIECFSHRWHTSQTIIIIIETENMNLHDIAEIIIIPDYNMCSRPHLTTFPCFAFSASLYVDAIFFPPMSYYLFLHMLGILNYEKFRKILLGWCLYIRTLPNARVPYIDPHSSDVCA